MISSDQLAALLRIVDPEERARFYAQHNPDVINLSVAENVLIYDFLREHVFEDLGVIELEDAKYVRSHGNDELREEVAALLSDAFEVRVEAEHVFGTAGVSAALECLAFTLFDPCCCEGGKCACPPPHCNKVLIPAPCWQGFKWSFEQRPHCGRVVTFGKEPQITLAEIEQAWKENQDTKILVLTNPSNPLGINYKEANLNDIYEWVLDETEMDIISDEMYCHSQVADAQPEFVSALKLQAYAEASEKQRKRVHVVWGFAKDFGLSGFKAGFIVSTSEEVEAALTDDGPGGRKGMAWFTPMDSLKHFVLLPLLTNKMETTGARVREQAMIEYQVRLTTAWKTVKELLAEERIKYFEDSNAAQFFWLDLSEYLDYVDRMPCCSQQLYEPPQIPPEEARLECYLREQAKVQLLPGSLLSNPEAGCFRLCYTAEPGSKVETAIREMGKKLDELRSSPG
ncbi:MAG: aminotransferase class I/II-fold pyridoxal phosphate-dependent enzyme [bacterium]|nr:aminotransferase class I/II-fold pyridoxal phosphate-dependent enzyme [bacterium]